LKTVSTTESACPFNWTTDSPLEIFHKKPLSSPPPEQAMSAVGETEIA
jgi:hypothetical protein